MRELSSIEREAINDIKPAREEYEYISNVFNRIKKRIENYFRERGIEAEVTLQGSVAHDTWLRGDRDIDVFVLFPKETPVEVLRSEYFKLLVEALKSIGRIELRYAEHPYVRLYVDDVEADIVPAYKLDSPDEIKTAVDRTPFHTRYVNSHLDPRLRDHVRLLKRFMKSIGVYGAEIKVRGFSGYVVELLVITYGGFREVLEAASKWKPPVYVNTLGLDVGGFRELIRRLRRRYPDSVIYVPDPVDPGRNAAANVSMKSLAIFSLASRCYLSNPSKSFFSIEVTSYAIEQLHNLLDNRCIIVLELGIDKKVPPDVLWGELYRVADRAVKVLRNHEFNVYDYSVWSDEESIAYIALEIDECVKKYPRLYRGPDFWKYERSLDFIVKHVERNSIGPWISSSGELLSLGRRKYEEAERVLDERMWEYMVAPDFKDVKPRIHVVSRENLRYFLEKEGVGGWISSFIVKRPHWMRYCTR
jgi:tRNA nucleotidyltransferase (CCA-adding enzyme)